MPERLTDVVEALEGLVPNDVETYSTRHLVDLMREIHYELSTFGRMFTRSPMASEETGTVLLMRVLAAFLTLRQRLRAARVTSRTVWAMWDRMISMMSTLEIALRGN